MTFLEMSGPDFVQYVKSAIEKCDKIQKTNSCFTEILKEKAIAQAIIIEEKIKEGTQGPLAGLLVTVKDNICMKDTESCACSDILRGFKPTEDATVIKLLKEQDAIIIARTTMDEFGFGSWNTNPGSSFPVPKNPHDEKRVTGGSSGGAAVATAMLDFPHVALAESTGGSIENPASLCGVVGFCPTYGLFSRQGLIPYANSLDKIGLMAKSAKEIDAVLRVLAKQDPTDATSVYPDFKNASEKPKIGILSSGAEPEIIKALDVLSEKLKAKGHIVKNTDLPLTSEFGVPTYYILATCEASTNLASFCGLRYGVEGRHEEKSLKDYFTGVRSKSFGNEAKRRIVLGTFARMHGYRDAYYIKATKVRTKIIEEYEKAFEEFDILLTPTLTTIAPTLEEVEKLSPLETYKMDQLTVGPNLAGVPHVSVPLGKSKGMPFGVMAISNHLHEKELIRFISMMEGPK